MSWHTDDGDLRDYVADRLTPPRLWSIEEHLAACGQCREALNARVDLVAVDAGWARLDAELDAPRLTPVEAMLLWMSVAEHTARLLAATPVLRRSWMSAVVLTLLLAVVAGKVGSPLPLLAAAPLLPLAGVAVSFGPGLDPTYEMSVVAPLHTFRLLMVRTVAVLATTVPLTLLASLALPSYGLAALGWLLPAFALTATGLALTPRLGPAWALALVGGVWLAAVVLGRLLAHGSTPAPFTAAGQLAMAALAVAASVLLIAVRDRFDSVRSLRPVRPLRLTAGRLS